MRTCSVCKDSRRVEIDAAIHRGLFTSEIARRCGFTKPTVTGHRRSGHHLLQPRRVYTGPHTASSLLTRIVDRLGDDEAIKDLRIAASTLPPAERIVLIEELRRRAGRVEAAQEPERMATFADLGDHHRREHQSVEVAA